MCGLEVEDMANQTATKKLNQSGGIKSFFISIWHNKMSRAGLLIIIMFLLMAILGPIFLEEPHFDYLNRLKGPSWDHWLGTDYSGKDTLIQLVLGAKDVLLVSFYAGVFTVLFACVIGIVSGLLGGTVDTVLMAITNIVITIPSFPLTMILTMIMSIESPVLFGLVLSIQPWAGLAKAIRSQVLVLRNREFIEASRTLGLSTPQ